MVSATEAAFEMIDAFNDGDDSKKIIGVYDAPIKGIQEDANQTISSLAMSLAEQIKQANDRTDSIVIRVKVPQE